MKELQDLLHELRCDINYCKVSFENDTEINNANDTLLKVDNIVKNLTIPDVRLSFSSIDKAVNDLNLNKQVGWFVLNGELVRIGKKCAEAVIVNGRPVLINEA